VLAGPSKFNSIITIVQPRSTEQHINMQDTINLKNPHRPIRVGVILLNSSVLPHCRFGHLANQQNSVTEILDVAPIDMFASLSKDFIHQFPSELVTDEMAKQALDVQFHWVTEHGQEGKLTAGAIIKPTVSYDFATHPTSTNVCSTTSKLAHR
jgi:hypothetical protein